LIGKIVTKLQFIRKIHNKIQIDKNMEKMQDKKLDTNEPKKKDFEMEFDL
jgi:hypothetical protein